MTAVSRENRREKREQVRKRVQSATNSENYTYYPEKENITHVKNDEYQRVGIYARVSTDDPSQTSSFELQQKYYTDMVSKNPNWELVKIYTDEGKSGTTTQHREGLQEMLDDAFNGKLDLIIVKNISRLARNVVDFLGIVRKLREKKVGVLFESEGIYTMNTDSNLALSMHASMAEQESRLRSRSMETSLRMRLDHGLPLTPELLGFYKGDDGKLHVNSETKDIPKLMFFMYLYGYSTKQIAETLKKLSKKSYLGNIKWTAGGVANTLRNERYCGDVLTRKRFKVFAPDVDQQKSFKNNGEKPQSYYKKEHEWIVTHDDFVAVQRIMNNAKYGGASLLPELKVIPEGLLKGFVIVHPKWGSFTMEDYITACRSVDKEEADEPAQIYAEAGEFDYREFEVVDFRLFHDQNVPAVTFAQKEVKFNQSCIQKMNCGNYIELLVHPIKKQIAIRKSDKNNRCAIQWSMGSQDNPSNRNIACRAYIKTIYEIFGWKMDRKYKLYGQIYRDGESPAAIFTEMNASVYIHKEEYFSVTGKDATGQIACSGNYIKAIAGTLGLGFGNDYYVERSRSELTKLTKEEWKTNMAGRMYTAKDKLNVTPYEELRSFIKDQLGDLFEENGETLTFQTV